MQAGVDEAGKGPVLGSMFVAAVLAEPGTIPEAVDDSKSIPPDRRRALAAEIRDVAAAVEVVEIPVTRIDDPETDMNRLTVAGQADALSEVLDAGDAGSITGYLDAADTDAARFERRVRERLDGPVDLRAEHGADGEYAIVGAASILAKVARERHVDTLRTEYGAVGSGYPSDPATREFLESYVESQGTLPPCARESWQTSRDALAALDQSSLADF